jgi:FkbM family methyltransferase
VLDACEFLTYSVNDDIVSKIYFFFGPVSYDSLSIALWTKFSKAARNGILDVGAYTGVFSLIAKRINDDVPCVAFEPVPIIRARLLENLTLNKLKAGIMVEPLAISSGARLTAINVGQGMLHLDSGASLEVKPHKRAVSGEIVQTISLDQYLGGKPGLNVSLIKIDVELHELEALSGAKATIEKMRPIVLCEVERTRSFKPVSDFFIARDYRVLVVDDDACRLIPLDGPDLPGRLSTLRAVFNIIGLPGREQEDSALAIEQDLHRLYPVLEQDTGIYR